MSPANTLSSDELLGENPDLKAALGKLAKYVSDTVAFGSKVFDWCLSATTGGGNPTLAQLVPLLFIRNALERADAISILVGQSAIEPARILQRSLLEIVFCVSYMLQQDTADRTAAYVVTKTHQELKEIDRMDASTQQGKQFRSKFGNDIFLDQMLLSQPSNLQSMRTDRVSRLALPAYAKAEAEYQRLISSGRKSPAWHSFFSGPPTVEQIALTIDMPGLYELWYRGWSQDVHASNAFSGLHRAADGTMHVLRFRVPTDAESTTSETLSLLLYLFQVAVQEYDSGKEGEYVDWYVNNMHQPYREVSSGNPIIRLQDV